MIGRFRVLGVDLRVEGPTDVVSSIGAAYARFKIPANSPAPHLCVTVPPGSPDAEMLLYQRFLAAVLLHAEPQAVFHGAALVDRGGGGLLLAGPSGHGKSSLTLALVERGFGFLGDDYAPLDLSSATLWPFPRTASVLPGGTAPLPEGVRRLAERREAPRLFGKALVDIGAVFPEALRMEPAPLRTVVVLGAPGTETDVSFLHLAARAADGARLASALAGIAGVVVESDETVGGQRRWSLRVEHAQGPTEALGALVEDEAVLYSERTWSGPPDFTQRPSASPLKRREAAVLLTRELLNRRRGSRFLQGRADGIAGIVLDVAQALRPAECFQVRVGRFAETVDLIERLTERSAS